MDKLFTLLLAAAVAVGSAGCSSVSMPNWLHPGPAVNQQSRAERFDPYPQNESGPEIVGARPRAYQKPPPEVSRARWLPWSWGGG